MYLDCDRRFCWSDLHSENCTNTTRCILILNQFVLVLNIGRLRTFVLGLTVSVRPTVLNGFLQSCQHVLIFRVHRYPAENSISREFREYTERTFRFCDCHNPLFRFHVLLTLRNTYSYPSNIFAVFHTISALFR